MRIILLFVLNAAFNLGLGLAIAALLEPSDYGRFAVGMTVSIVLAMAAFDWLRLSATRFYGEARRQDSPDLRASLNAAYLALAALLGLLLTVALVVGVTFGLGAGLLAAAVLCGSSNGLFDFQAALARARFHDRSYATLVLVKNVCAIGLGVGAALTLKSPSAVLAATAVGALLAVAVVLRDLHDHAATLRRATSARVKSFAAYGLPVVLANVIFQVVVLMNRSDAAASLGYAEAGRLSLATDLGLRLLLAVGSAIDVFVFQLAVRREAEEGQAAAAAQLRRNAVIVVAVLVLIGVGYAMAMPAFEALLVPVRYRGPFGSLTLILLPGMVLFCIAQFAVNPIFQLANRTAPVVAAALVTLLVDAVGLALTPVGAGVTGLALVHSISLAVGTAAIVITAMSRSNVLRADADYLRIVLAAALTAIALWPLRGLSPAWLALGGAALVGTTVYALSLFALNVAGLRTLVIGRIESRQGAVQSV